MSSPWLRALKFWQTKSAKFIWQVQVNTGTARYKTYLIADANQKDRGITLTKNKPEDIHPQGPAAIQVRKHAKTGSMRALYEDISSGDLWLPIHLPKAGPESAPDYYILLSKTKPPVLSFIETESSLSFVRISSQGSFTKKVPFDGPLPHLEQAQFCNIMADVVATYDPNDSEQERLAEAANDEVDDQRRTAINQVKRRIKTLKKSLRKEQGHSSSEEEALILERDAKLLQSFSHLVKPDVIELKLDAATTGLKEDVIVPIDPDMTTGQNIESKFIEAKKTRRAFRLGEQQVKKVNHSLQQAEDALLRLQSDDALNEETLLTDLGIRKKHTQRVNAKVVEKARPYKEYLSEETRILVGKGAKENDELTKKAKGNDFWLHAVGVTGSHVIVEGNKFRKQNLPESIFRDAAILALHFSKLKGDMAGEVYYTRRSNIKKQKGMPAGLWNVEHSKSVFVRYDKVELDKTLGKVVL